MYKLSRKGVVNSHGNVKSNQCELGWELFDDHCLGA